MQNKISGIYKIINKVNGKIYIGSSKDIRNRWHRHRYVLKAGTHHSPHLQASWNKYGEDNFEIVIVEECSIDDLLPKEQYYLDNLQPEYNFQKIAGAPPIDPERSRQIAKDNWASGVWDHRLRPIERIDPNTGEVKEYESIADAVSEGFKQSCIWYCLDGRKASYANYYWQYADGSSPEVKVKYEKMFRKVIGTSLDGTNVFELSSFEKCHSQGFNYGKIRACCAGVSGRRTHNGFTWQYADEYIQGKAEQNKAKTFSETFCKAVVRIDPKTNERKEYESQAATEKDGFSQKHVSSCCRGKRKSHGGYIWEFLTINNK